MIILTPDDANKVRGLTVSGHALAPKPFLATGCSDPFLDGKFGLPEACADDPFHAVYSDFLKSLPTIPDENIQQGTSEGIGYPVVGSDWDLSEEAVKYNYTSEWPAECNIVEDSSGVASAVPIPGDPLPPIELVPEPSKKEITHGGRERGKTGKKGSVGNKAGHGPKGHSR